MNSIDKHQYQLCDEQGDLLPGHGAFADEIFDKGLLHAAAHIWIWRRKNGGIEILLQQRGPQMRTWPGRYDISAAGHVNLGETPLAAALRETAEELGLKLDESHLHSLGTFRAHMTTDSGAIENEIQWLYTFELTGSHDLHLQASEVASAKWLPLKTFEAEVAQENLNYVPHHGQYFRLIIAEVKRQAQL